MHFGGGVSGGPLPLPSGATFVTAPQGQLQEVVTQQHAAELNQLLIWSIVALAIMVVGSIGLGWFLAGRVLDPLRAMTATVREISATNLRQRVAPEGPDDELKDLGSTFDDLLGRLERSFEAQRQFVANASHELRTPLARQRTLLQVALDDPKATAESLRSACERVLVAEKQQERLIDLLLTLANSERGLEHRERVDLAGSVAHVLDLRRSEIEARGLALNARTDPAIISGDPRLIERLVSNLVDNAVKYSRKGGRLEVATSTAEGSAILRVTNDGLAVSPADVDRLFEPFRRLGPDRTGQGEGWGLGLSIVRAIAVAHDGTAKARPGPSGGLEIEVHLPTSA